MVILIVLATIVKYRDEISNLDQNIQKSS